MMRAPVSSAAVAAAAFAAMRDPVSAPEAQPHAPASVAHAWAGAIMLHGEAMLASGALAHGEVLRVIDVRPRSGALAWPVLAFLHEGVAVATTSLPGFQYVACAWNKDELAALRGDACLASLEDAGLFQSIDQGLAVSWISTHPDPAVVREHFDDAADVLAWHAA
jgi:hypothetical protein